MPKPGPKISARLMAKTNSIENGWKSLPPTAFEENGALDFDETSNQLLVRNKDKTTAYHSLLVGYDVLKPDSEEESTQLY